MRKLENTVIEDVSFEAIENKEIISTLKSEWRKTLAFHFDASDESDLHYCQHWLIKLKETMIGYACVSKENTLFNFYISPKYLSQGVLFLDEFIKQREIEKAYASTNNPISLSLIMHFQKSIEIDSYLFKDMEEVNNADKNVEFKLAEAADQEGLVNFNYKAHGYKDKSQKFRDRLKKYCGDSIRNKEVFILLKNNEIIGLLEAITFDKGTKLTSLGVVVLPEYRNQGYGNYLFVEGKSLAKSRASEAICSCNANNISSRKAIEKSGFRILHLHFLVSFN